MRTGPNSVSTDPVRHIMRDYWMSPFKVLALFPEWYGPKQSDWPPQTVVTRFPLYDDSDQVAVSEDLAAFLDAGDAPVLFTPGRRTCRRAVSSTWDWRPAGGSVSGPCS